MKIVTVNQVRFNIDESRNKFYSVRLIMFLLLIISILILTACSSENSKAVKTIKSHLKNKYNQEFEFVDIGDNIGLEYMVYYFNPIEDSSNMFEVIYSDGIVYDTYVKSIISRKLEEIIEQEFLQNKISTNCSINIQPRLYIGTETNLDMELEEFLRKYYIDNILLQIDCDLEYSEENVINIITIISNLYKDYDCEFSCYIYGKDFHFSTNIKRGKYKPFTIKKEE